MRLTLNKVLLFITAIVSLSGIVLGMIYLTRADKLGFQLLFSLNTGFFAILLACFLIYKILAQKIKSSKMAEIAGDIRIGAHAYLTRQIRTILLFSPILLVIIFGLIGWQDGWKTGLITAITTIIGIFTSLTAAFIGMSVCVRANLRTASSASESKTMPFRLAIMGGSVMGLCITGFSLVVLAILFTIFKDPKPLVGFGFGASLAALFAQIGGGIFTKSADVGADLVGKMEMKIPEDDPRNAAVVADLVGDNVGDCAGRGADLLQTFADDIVTGVIVALATVVATQGKFGVGAVFFPLILKSVGVLSSCIGILFTGLWNGKAKFTTRFNIGLWVSIVLSIISGFLVAVYVIGDIRIGYGIMFGVLVTTVASISTSYYAGISGKPVHQMATASKRGAALNLITGLGHGLQSPFITIVVIVLGIIFSYNISGGMLIGIVGINIGTDLLITFIMAADAFGPIVDNAAGIASMAKEPEEVVDSLSSLDSVGNTMKAVTKAYAMASGTITAFVIFATFFTQTRIDSFRISEPFALGFLFIGIALPYLVSSMVIQSTARGAIHMVDEIRRQFRENPLIMKGRAKPDYARCVDITTKNALREMILPGSVSVLVPVLVGFAINAILPGQGPMALGALMIGAVASSALLGPFFNNVGTAFDNAKKLVEETHGAKGTFQHQAAVVGDTVGDPLKDVAGPSVLIFMKLMGMAALLIAPLLVSGA
jgi:K(+)-stimulated pyrophosphate-energized sodium pump